MQYIIDQAINSLEREAILKQANEIYAFVRNSKEDWQEQQEEIDLWESALEDGLETI